MPSKTRAQHNYMAMASTAKGRKKLKASGRKKLPSIKVAKEFLAADRGKKKRR